MKESNCKITMAKYSIGDLVHHKLFDYRGVIVDIDPYFQLTDQWYETVARSRPPKNEPWYHVLVHQATHATYVAEQNLEPDSSDKEIIHPLIDTFFTDLKDGRYINSEKVN
ncbi:heat shock protein HspQ [Photobacterium sp. SDRW27]|uniref:heat shock protein HspQ n=1 Tax=Photobacterium obscurum TaxID=2829490 RepID=UPI0022444B8E|nr:heat shock protein HspQ [Photobacterium obscurum]MCW8328986.1 heat shock protein HspQ [Photobacterium obscurum]